MMVPRKQGINLEDVQELNRALVIRLLRKERICSRADIAKQSGLKQSTITRIINDFIGWNLVTERGIINGEKGRRSIGISLNTELFKVVAVRLARKYFSVGIYDLWGTGDIVLRDSLEVFEGSKKAVHRIVEAVTALISEQQENRFLGIGVAIPGPILPHGREDRPDDRVSRWEQIHWRKSSARRSRYRSFLSTTRTPAHWPNGGWDGTAVRPGQWFTWRPGRVLERESS